MLKSHLEKLLLSSKVTVAHRQKPETIVIEKLPVNYRNFQRASVAAIAILSLSAVYLYMLSFNPQAVDKAGLNFFSVPIIDSADLERLEITRQIEEDLDESERAIQKREISSKETLVAKDPGTQEEQDNLEKETTEAQQVALENATQEPIDTEESDVSEQNKESTNAPLAVLVDKDDLKSQFHVIVSVLSSVDRIDAEVKKFKVKGYEPIILPAEVGKYRISIGAFATRDSADTFKKNIYNDNSIDSWILKK